MLCVLYQNYYLQKQLSIAILYSNYSIISKFRYLIPIFIYVMTVLFYLNCSSISTYQTGLFVIATATTGSLINYLIIESIILKTISDVQGALRSKDLLFLSFVPLGLIILNILINLWCLEIVVIIVLNFFSLFILCSLFHLINHLVKERINSRLKESVLADNTNHLLRLKHDLLKEYRLVQQLLKSDKIKDAQDIINGQVSEIEVIKPIFKTGHDELDYILNIKQQEAQKHHIIFNAELSLSQMIRNNYGELSLIVWNLIDNAIDACKLVEGDRIINITMSYDHDVLLLLVKNTYNNAHTTFEDGEYITTKEDKTLHGHGLNIIKKLAQKYDGEINIERQDHVFSIEMLLFIN